MCLLDSHAARLLQAPFIPRSAQVEREMKKPAEEPSVWPALPGVWLSRHSPTHSAAEMQKQFLTKDRKLQRSGELCVQKTEPHVVKGQRVQTAGVVIKQEPSCKAFTDKHKLMSLKSSLHFTGGKMLVFFVDKTFKYSAVA